MAGVVWSAIIWATVAATPVLVPSEAKQGDFVVLRVPDKNATAVRAWFQGEEIPVAAVGSGWQGIIGIDLAAPWGPREVTGITVTSGKVESWAMPIAVTTAGFPVQYLTLADESKVDLSAKDLKRVERESAAVRKIFRARTERKWSGTFEHPLSGKPAGGRFGSLRVINNQPRNAHSGADYGVPKGEPVRATNSGKVVLVDEHFFAGNSIFIDHGDGLVSMYFHLSQALVKPGQTIKKGEIIGKVGSTGRSSGPHLHFGINFRGARINPASLLEHELE